MLTYFIFCVECRPDLFSSLSKSRTLTTENGFSSSGDSATICYSGIVYWHDVFHGTGYLRCACESSELVSQLLLLIRHCLLLQ